MLMVHESADDVGDMLMKVKDDLKKLRNRMSEVECTSIDKDILQSALDKTECTIQRHTEDLMLNMSNKVTILPTIGTDDTKNVSAKIPKKAGQTKISLGLRKPHGRNSDVSYLEGFRHAGLANKLPIQTLGLTPGQLSQEIYKLRIMSNPQHPHSRQVLHDHYDIQLPTIQQRQSMPPLNRIVYGSTIEHLAVLPKQNRNHPLMEPPPIHEKDTKFGILSLLERGLIPYNADIDLNPPPVRQKSASLHDPIDKRHKSSICEAGENLAAYKLDTIAMFEGISETPSIIRMPTVPSHTTASMSDLHESSVKSRSSVKSYSKQAIKLSELALDLPGNIEPPPTTPATVNLKDTNAPVLTFAIQRGVAREDTKEFQALKEKYCLTWGCVSVVLLQLETLMKKYNVPVAFVNGDKMADLSVERELDQPSYEELMNVVENRSTVEKLINLPGRRFHGQNGEEIAAAKIQATWKAYKQHHKYSEYRRKKWAAGVIAISWVMTIKLANVRKQLKVTRQEHIASHKIRLTFLAQSWTRIQNSRRVIIHIPSLGVAQHIRDNMRDLNLKQNMQMARLCDISDPNVDVIYISPVSMNDELLQYYQKLLGLFPAVESGDVENQGDLNHRYRIIVPEAVNSFPTHSMSLSTILKYSPKALKRITNLVRGRNAYIVPRIPHKDDLHISDVLDVPVVCSEPEVAQLYSTKSGSKRIFASANVDMPPGEYDVYSLQQLHECLSQLVTDNLDVQRWLFKVDDECDGRGIAYCDIPANLRCYNWALKESRRYGDKWIKKWAQDAAFIKIQAEIPQILSQFAIPANTNAYPTWSVFLEEFLSQGGVIEACPPSSNMNALTVDMFIAPTGQISLVSCGDQIHAESQLACWGLSVPQASVQPHVLNEKCLLISEACKIRGIVGHFSIDFVTFINEKTDKQILWATDLSIQYSDSVSMFSFLKFVTAGSLDTQDHIFNITTPVNLDKRIVLLPTGSEVEIKRETHRYAVMSTRLFHNNLAVIHYSVFFQMCRAHGIGYDLKEKQGTVFTLVDGLSREHLGMLSIGESLQQSLAMFARNLHVIHQEISAPNMQGLTNFKYAVNDIEKILSHMQENAQDIETNLEEEEEILVNAFRA